MMVFIVTIIIITTTCHAAWISPSTPLMPVANKQMAIGSYQNSSIFLIGGGDYPKKVQEYDITANEFIFSSNILSSDTWGSGDFSTQIGNIVYMVDPGGDYLSKFDMQNRAFSTIPKQTKQNLGAKACLTSKPISTTTYLYVVGGGPDSIVPLQTVYILNLNTLFWISSSDEMKVARRRHSCIIDSANYLYAIGGQTDFSLDVTDTVEYSDVSDTRAVSWKYTTNNLYAPVRSHQSILVGNKIYVTGGDGSKIYVSIIDTSTKTISTSSERLLYRVEQHSVIMVQNIIYIFGGCCSLNTWMKYTFPTADPTKEPSTAPTGDPTPTPTANPTRDPTPAPIATPAPTANPTAEPSPAPTDNPTKKPTATPTDNPTKKPTTAPTDNPTACTASINTAATTAWVSGNTHFKLWNNEKHHFKGKLSGASQYYYMHPCHGVTRDEMPFNLLGTHKYIATAKAVGLFDIVLELYDNNGDEYIIWFSSSSQRWTFRDSTINTLYLKNINLNASKLQNSVQTKIGNRFNALYTFKNNTYYHEHNLAVQIDTNCKLQLYMQYQNYETLQFLYVMPPECYKCYTCGLFGDFNTYLPQIPMCNGNLFTIIEKDEDGYKDQIYDINGWSWEKEYVKDKCPFWDDRRRNRRLRSLNEYTIDIDYNFTHLIPCNFSNPSVAAEACQLARDSESICCDDIIGGEFCDILQTFCAMDLCIVSKGIEAFAGASTYDIFTNHVYLVCNIPNITEIEDPTNLIGNGDTSCLTYTQCNEYGEKECCEQDVSCYWKQTELCLYEGGPNCCTLQTKSTVTTQYQDDTDQANTSYSYAASMLLFVIALLFR